MPRSKRAKVVSLSKVAKVASTKEFRKAKVELIREAVDEYKNIFIFSFANLRESKLKEVRMHWKESRIYRGKNTVAQVALGKTPEDEVRDNLHLLSQVRCGAYPMPTLSSNSCSPVIANPPLLSTYPSTLSPSPATASGGRRGPHFHEPRARGGGRVLWQL